MGDDYYLATSTFEWFPGVAIHHSRDLVHWRLLTHALRETRLLDLRGIPGSGGVIPSRWKIHLCYSVIRQHESATKDTLNFLVTAPSIEGLWSTDRVSFQPIGPALDASILSDDHGKHWGFTGTFAAITCQDLTGEGRAAEFDYLEIIHNPH